MNSFAFHNPALVRRFGTILVVGTSALLIVLALLLANVVLGKYDDIAAQQDTVARAERVAGQQTDSPEAATFYSAETPQLAQSQMQTDMQAIAEQNQVRLEVIRADQIEDLGGSLRMALTLNGVVPESELGAYLTSLASHDPMIVVESVSLRRARAANRNVDSRPLAVQLKLSGFATK
jgi:hypothetical protein